MGPSERAFQQVRNILGKLDRNIDQLRTTRTTPEAPAVAPTQVPTKPGVDRDRLVGERSAPGSQAGAQQAKARANSMYGRATPIPPSGN